MRSTTLRRRASYGLLSAGLVAAGLVPSLAAAAAAACPTYVDDAGDAAPGDPALAAVAQDDGLDVLAVTHSTAGGVFSSTVKTAQLLETGSDNSFGDWFQVGFTVLEKVVTVRVVRDASLQPGTTTRLQVDGVTAEALPEAVYDFKAATVTLKVKQADLEKAVGSNLAGKAFSAMETLSYGYFGGPGLLFDEAVAPEGAAYVFGTACKGAAGAKPAPAPSAAASPKPTASASASAGPAASPTSSAGASPSASAAPSPTGPPPAPLPAVPVPAAGCVGFTDPAGDSDAAVGPAGAGDDPDVDLLSVTGRTTTKAVAGHLAVSALGTGPSFPAFTGHRFELELTVGAKLVVLSASETGPGEGTVDGASNTTLLVDAVFDEPSSQVVLSVDRASLVKATGTALPDGVALTDLAARSYAVSPVSESVADTAAGGSYVVGDNTCFRPALSVTTPGSVQTSDLAVVSVALTTSDGRTAPNQTVTARVGGGRTVSAKTDGQGTVTLSVPVTEAAGARTLVVRSSGSAGDGELRTPVTVVVERSVLAVRATGSGASRTVTATLTDDDAPRRMLGGQKVTFAFGGRTVTATTDDFGRATTTVPAGSTVDVAFAGRSGFLSSSKARATA